MSVINKIDFLLICHSVTRAILEVSTLVVLDLRKKLFWRRGDESCSFDKCISAPSDNYCAPQATTGQQGTAGEGKTRLPPGLAPLTVLVASSHQKLPGLAGNHWITVVTASGPKSCGALPGFTGDRVLRERSWNRFCRMTTPWCQGVAYCPDTL